MKQIVLLILVAGVSVVAAPQFSSIPEQRQSRRLNCMAPNLAEVLDGVVQGGQIICRDKEGGRVSIPASEVTEVVYDFTSLADPISQDPRDYLCAECGILNIPLAVLGPLIAREVNAIQLRPHPYVFLYWMDDLNERVAIFRIKEKKALPLFLAQLSDRTGKDWKDRFQEREQADKEAIETALDQKFGIRLDWPVHIGDSDVAAGMYDVSVSPSEAGGDRLYLDKRQRFKGKRTVAQARIEILDRHSPASQSYDVVYCDTDDRVVTVAEIRTPRTVIRLIPERDSKNEPRRKAD